MTTYFISGHRNITKQEYLDHYAKRIIDIVMDRHNQDYKFIVGDCEGVDYNVQKFLAKYDCNVVVYHIGTTPRYCVEGLRTIGGFTSDFERDFQMTLDSDEDIAWVRHKRSGTQMNLDRRIWLNERKAKGLTYTKEDLMIRDSNNFI